MRIYVRYELPNESEETRRERNERVEQFTPEFEIPSGGEFLWEIFIPLTQSINRIVEGAYRLIPPSEYEAWFRLTGTLVYPQEYGILRAMDKVFCEEANKELEDHRSRREEKMRQEAEQNAAQQRRGK